MPYVICISKNTLDFNWNLLHCLTKQKFAEWRLVLNWTTHFVFVPHSKLFLTCKHCKNHRSVKTWTIFLHFIFANKVENVCKRSVEWDITYILIHRGYICVMDGQIRFMLKYATKLIHCSVQQYHIYITFQSQSLLSSFYFFQHLHYIIFHELLHHFLKISSRIFHGKKDNISTVKYCLTHFDTSVITTMLINLIILFIMTPLQ